MKIFRLKTTQTKQCLQKYFKLCFIISPKSKIYFLNRYKLSIYNYSWRNIKSVYLVVSYGIIRGQHNVRKTQ